MKLNETYDYPAGPEAVYALISDADFRKAAAVSGGAEDVTVTIEPDGDGHTVTIVRTEEADMPDFVKKISGDKVTVKQVEQWGAPDADGSRKAKVKMSVSGQPAGMEGTAAIKPDGKGTDFTVSGDVKVSIPFVGKKVEPLIARAIKASLRHDVDEGKKRL
jgi:hypothetical protein